MKHSVAGSNPQANNAVAIPRDLHRFVPDRRCVEALLVRRLQLVRSTYLSDSRNAWVVNRSGLNELTAITSMLLDKVCGSWMLQVTPPDKSVIHI
jgi:hypothetical protein